MKFLRTATKLWRDAFPPAPYTTLLAASAKEPDKGDIAGIQLWSYADPNLDQKLKGFLFEKQSVNHVMSTYAVGDVRTLLLASSVLDEDDTILSEGELVRAAQALVAKHNQDLRWSPSTMARMMQQETVRSPSAVLAAARRMDNGDRTIDESELAAAISLVAGIAAANDVREIYRRIDELHRAGLGTLEVLGHAPDGQPIQALHFGPAPEKAKLRVAITGGVHGNEPCGAAAAIMLADLFGSRPHLCQDISITVVPMVNPRGLAANTRRTPEDIDPNRQGAEKHPIAEVQAVAQLFDTRSFDLSLDLHSGYAKRNGFWVYHQDAADLFGPVMNDFGKRWPTLQGPGAPESLSDIPGLAASDNPGTIKGLAYRKGTRWTCTVEAPGSVGYHDQVLGEMEIVLKSIDTAYERIAGNPRT